MALRVNIESMRCVIKLHRVAFAAIKGFMKLLFTRSGRCSSFGGPFDMGVSSKEGLALFEPSDIADRHFSHLFREVPRASLGLARNLSEYSHYCAMRWDYALTSRSKLRNAIVRVSWQDSSPVWCHPADWGPADSTGRIVDISPAAMKALGCSTDSIVECQVWL